MSVEIIAVSGLPRSGTSLMMQMLHAGGVEVLTDHVRAADTDNPRGYLEFERVKTLKRDTEWIPSARGKVFKLVSQLLYDLPATEKYRILFMERNLDEVLQSQEKMLTRLGRQAAPRDEMKRAFTLHLDRLNEWLSRQSHMTLLPVRYQDLVEQPRAQSERVAAFLGRPLNLDAMVNAVDPALYRNRQPAKV